MGCRGSKQAAAPAPVQKAEGDFKITLERATEEQALGVTFLDDAAAGLLSIEAIKEEGLLPEFMKANENAPQQHVKVGDRIIAVNAVTGDLDNMKAQLNQKTVVLTVQRPPVEQPAPAPAPAAEASVAPTAATEPAAEPETAEKKDAAAATTEDVTAASGYVPEGATTTTAAVPAPTAAAQVPEATAEPAATASEAAVAKAVPAHAVDAPAPADTQPAPAQPAFKLDDAAVNDCIVNVELDGEMEAAQDERICKMSMC